MATLSMWDAMTRHYILQVTGVPVTPIYTAMTQDANGNLIIYYIDQTSKHIEHVNSTRCINLGGTPLLYSQRSPMQMLMHGDQDKTYPLTFPMVFNGRSH